MNTLRFGFKRVVSLIMVLVMAFSLSVSLTACGGETKEKILIYTSVEDYLVEFMQQELNAKFPEYDIVIDFNYVTAS